MLAQLPATFGEDEPTDNADQTPQWLRGLLRAHARGFEIEVNSEARLDALLDVLEALELEPALTRRWAIDPPMDKPPIQLGGPAPFGSLAAGDRRLGRALARRARASARRADAPRCGPPRARAPAAGGAPARIRARRLAAHTRRAAGPGCRSPPNRAGDGALVGAGAGGQSLSARRSAAAASRA